MRISDRLADNNNVFTRVAPYLTTTSTLRNISFLQERLKNYDSYVVLLGETGSGKSTILNGLLADNCMPTGPTPTTGSIVEIIFEEDEDKWFMVQSDGKIKRLTRVEFQQLCRSGHQEGERLQFFTNKNRYDFSSGHFFDTPGFGSIIDEHEVIAKEFIPQCDIVVYVIDYRTGVSPDDANLLRYVKSILDESAEFIFVINRVFVEDPQSKGRIEEITNHVSDIMQHAITPILEPGIGNDGSTSDKRNILPPGLELWSEVKLKLAAPDRKRRYEFGKLLIQQSIIEDIILGLSITLMTKGDTEALHQSSRRVFEHQKEIIALVNERYNQLRAKVPGLLNGLSDSMDKDILSEIEGAGKWTQKIETVSYINRFLFWKYSVLSADQLARYVQDEIEDLNRVIEDMLNTTIDEYRLDLKRVSFSDIEAAKRIVDRQASKLLSSGMEAFFLRYAGTGGLKSGIPNAAKAGLKQFGDFFGKTYSSETHNALAQLIKRIGANSARAVSLAAAVFIEGLLYVADVITWKAMLKRRIRKSLTTWKEKMETSVVKDLTEMRDRNVEVLNKMFEAFKPTLLDRKTATHLNTVRQLSAECDGAFLANKTIIEEYSNDAR